MFWKSEIVRRVGNAGEVALLRFCMRQSHQKEQGKSLDIGKCTLEARSALGAMDLGKKPHRPGSRLRAI